MTSRVVDVGVPSSKFQQWESKSKSNNNNEWEKTEVRFHDFAIISPEFSCLGHTWRLMLIVGEHYECEQNARGLVGMVLKNTSVLVHRNKSVSIRVTFSIKDSKNKVLGRIRGFNRREAEITHPDGIIRKYQHLQMNTLIGYFATWVFNTS